MYITFAGILDDGSRRADGVTASPTRALHIPRSANATIDLVVVRPDGTPVDLTNKDVLFAVKISTLDDVRLITKTGQSVTGMSTNVSRLELTPTDTRRLAPGRYLYDIWLVDGSIQNQLTPTAAFILEPTVRLP